MKETAKAESLLSRLSSSQSSEPYFVVSMARPADHSKTSRRGAQQRQRQAATGASQISRETWRSVAPYRRSPRSPHCSKADAVRRDVERCASDSRVWPWASLRLSSL